ncbi:MAG: PadR family transcriptional regulator [Gemmatimonadetes bacterium]|nr:PadR family transcriptional regulator [Gemmatimonadota bacterium]
MANEGRLARSAFMILVALADQPRHGLGIVDRIEEATQGRVRIGPGTLYGTLHRLVADGLIRETQERPEPGQDDPRRRYYRITRRGWRVLQEETDQWRLLVDAAARASGG